MSIIVEDGTGLPDANSYISVEEADTYHLDHGNPLAWSDVDTETKEEALRLATQYLDLTYKLRWLGIRLNSDQALAWPRLCVEDVDGYAIASNAVPKGVKEATSEMALKSLSEDILPDLETAASIKQEKVKVGPIEEDITYTGGKSPIKSYRKVRSLLSDLICPSTTVWRA